MKRQLNALLIVSLILISAQSIAIEPIKVLVSRTTGVANTQALNMLLQINSLMQKSNFSGLQFVNASSPSYVGSTSCLGSNYAALLQCAEDTLDDARDQFNADIVIMLVPTLGSTTCGAVPDEMINAFYILPSNRHLAYAVVSNQCMLTNGLFPASHEILHLLSIEHKRSDPYTNRPAGAADNHAATNGTYATAGARPVDCLPNGCTKFENIMSATDEKFSNGFSAGNSSHSNAARVVSNMSWFSVSNYRPLPLVAQNCRLQWELAFCSGRNEVGTVTALLPGYSVTNVSFDVSHNGGSSWIDIFDGVLTCPGVLITPQYQTIIRAILQSPQGVSQCSRPLSFSNCNGGGGGGGGPPNPY